MKKCKYCRTEIDKKAKICPNCLNKQSSIGDAILCVIVAIGIFIGLFAFTVSNNDTDYGDDLFETPTSNSVTLLDGHTGSVDGPYSYQINGIIQNNRSREYSYIQVEFYVYDASGNILDTCLANNSGLAANRSWKFTAFCYFPNGNSKDVVSYKLKEITQW